MAKYYLDCEFIEGKQDKKFLGIKYGETPFTIDLISIGIVSEDCCDFKEKGAGHINEKLGKYCCDKHKLPFQNEYYAISKDFNFNFFGDTKAEKVKKPKKTYETPQVSGANSFLVPAPVFDVAQIEVFNGQVDEFGNKIKVLPGIIQTAGMGITGSIVTPLTNEAMNALLLLDEFNAAANELIVGSIADTFGQLGTAIGEALANGGNVFKAIGNSLLQSLGKFLSDMGGMLIQYGTLAVVKGKLDLAIATGGPAAIVAGIAAIGVGIALKAIGGAISAKASGQGSGASVQGGNSYSSPSSSNSSGGGGSFSGGTVVFEISGQTLIGVLSNTLDRNKRLGGALAL